jgi:hypothetical protein
MTNRNTRRAGRRVVARPAAGGSVRHSGRRLLVLVAVAALVLLALASTALVSLPAATPTPTF